jgi:hypothetical protein
LRTWFFCSAELLARVADEQRRYADQAAVAIGGAMATKSTKTNRTVPGKRRKPSDKPKRHASNRGDDR